MPVKENGQEQWNVYAKNVKATAVFIGESFLRTPEHGIDYTFPEFDEGNYR